MTEEEWLGESTPMPLLQFVSGIASARKLRLYAVACCRGVWHLLKEQDSRLAVEVSEKFADGDANEEELGSEEWLSQEIFFEFGRLHESRERKDRLIATGALAPDEASEPSEAVLRAWHDAAYAVYLVANPDIGVFLRDCPSGLHSVPFLHEIIGNPFRPVTFHPSWRSSAAFSLALLIYKKRAFDRLPILADALEEAGCENSDILDHLRSDGPHFRGCWALDLVLDKS